MIEVKANKEADILEDRGERISMMEPLLLSSDSRHRPALTDLALDIAARSAGFRSSLPTGVRTALADLVRAMNCYYSNLIEGHDTHPVDIERALKNDYSADLGWARELKRGRVRWLHAFLPGNLRRPNQFHARPGPA